MTTTDKPMQCPACEGYHPQGGFAMAKLIERLVRENYVRPERETELLEKAKNMQAGKAFVTDAVLRERAAYAAGAPDPIATPDLGDFLK